MNAAAPDASTVLITSDSRVAPAAKRSPRESVEPLDEDAVVGTAGAAGCPIPAPGLDEVALEADVNL